ncbi:hypothetical protein [Nonomuraea sp. WAC 01424]|uniref:hypothetical protein n=1 Tax=Nonomuraea sp. WAC 01424 TaxID=2203200 RepID=UPI001C8C5EA2|nr:hypothetical protein [Nonomuraea sp. WAC 01424]
MESHVLRLPLPPVLVETVTPITVGLSAGPDRVLPQILENPLVLRHAAPRYGGCRYLGGRPEWLMGLIAVRSCAGGGWPPVLVQGTTSAFSISLADLDVLQGHVDVVELRHGGLLGLGDYRADRRGEFQRERAELRRVRDGRRAALSMPTFGGEQKSGWCF